MLKLIDHFELFGELNVPIFNCFANKVPNIQNRIADELAVASSRSFVAVFEQNMVHPLFHIL